MSLVARYYGRIHRINPSDPTQLLWCSEGSEHNNNWSVKYLPGQPEIYDLMVRRGYFIAETSNGLFYVIIPGYRSSIPRLNRWR